MSPALLSNVFNQPIAPWQMTSDAFGSANDPIWSFGLQNVPVGPLAQVGVQFGMETGTAFVGTSGYMPFKTLVCAPSFLTLMGSFNVNASVHSEGFSFTLCGFSPWICCFGGPFCQLVNPFYWWVVIYWGFQGLLILCQDFKEHWSSQRWCMAGHWRFAYSHCT